MKLKQNEIELLNDLLDYIEDSEAIDFEEQCHDKEVVYQDIIFSDDCNGMENHVFFKAMKLRFLLSNKEK